MISGVKRSILSTNQVMVRLGINKNKVRKLIVEKKLVGWKEGMFWVVDEKSVRDYAKNLKDNK